MTRNCADLSWEEVDNAVNGTSHPGHSTWSTPAADGDVVTLPSGTALWTNCLIITKNISLVGNTTVVETTPGDPSTLVATDNTVIQVGTTGSANQVGNTIYCSFNGSNTGSPVIKGITLDGSSTSTPTGASVLYIQGSHHSIRVTQCHFLLGVARYSFYTTGESIGVTDHCIFIQTAGSAAISTNFDTYNGGTKGDGSWTEDAHLLNSDPKRMNAWYFEDCAFLSPVGKHGSLDGQQGGRRVIRHCYHLNVAMACHGTESGGRSRGMRLVENYNNTVMFNSSGGLTGTQHRGGPAFYWGNTFTTTPAYSGFTITVNRQDAYSTNFSWGAANGVNPLDKNDSDGSGNYIPPPAGSPHQFYSGVISASTTVPTQWEGIFTPVTITLNDLPAQDWTGYAISNTTTGNIDPTYGFNNNAPVALITSNSGTTLNTESSANQNSPPCNWAPGDTVVIYRVLKSLDQNGSGKADLLTGNPPTNTSWPNQNTEPMYGWMNTNNGSPYTGIIRQPTNGPIPTVKENREFFNQVGGIQTSPTSPFNGTVGTGYGTLANRPTTCRPGWDKVPGDGPILQPQGDGNQPGVAYWATDLNTLYVATGVNTWTAYYQPAQYPHPLVGGGSSSKIILITGNPNFGNVIVGQSAVIQIMIHNNGDTNLTVTNVSVDNDVFSVDWTSGVIPPGGSQIVNVTFEPDTAQFETGTLTVTSDATGGTSTITTTGRGVGPSNRRPFDVWRRIRSLLRKL